MRFSVTKPTISILLATTVLLSLLAVTAGVPATASRLPAKFDADILDADASPRAIVGFNHTASNRTIRRLAEVGITEAVRLDTIDAVGVLGSIDSYKKIATWDDVTYVDDNSKLTFNNYSAKKDTNVDKVRKGAAPLKSKYTGKGSTVAIVDTGIWSPHPDLEDRVVKHLNFEGAWFFDMIQDGTYSDQAAEGSANPLDSYGHGTHVAGIVAGTGAATGGEGPDMSGVAPGAQLIDFKIADVTQGVDCTVPCDFGWEINAMVAYEYLIEHRNDKALGGGIDIATNSWSVFEVDSDVEPITLIVDAAAKKGVINLFAASNDGCPGDGTDTVADGPNSLASVLTVAAGCKSDGCGLGTIADFSSCGNAVDITAPGVDIYSTLAPSALGPIGGHTPPGPSTNAAYYTAFSGTSMATPHAAGIVALMLEANPKLNFKQIRSILTKTAKDYGSKGFDPSWGHGQVDALKAVAAAEKLR